MRQIADGRSSSPLLDVKNSALAAPNLRSRAECAIHFTCLLIIFMLASCATRDTQHQVVIVGGDVTFRDGEETGARPGRLVRRGA